MQGRHACVFAIRLQCALVSDHCCAGEKGFLGGCALLASQVAAYEDDQQSNLSVLHVDYVDIASSSQYDPFIYGRLPEGKMRMFVQHSVRPPSLPTDMPKRHSMLTDADVENRLESGWGSEGNYVSHPDHGAFVASSFLQSSYAGAPPGYLFSSLFAGSPSPLAPVMASSIAARSAYSGLYPSQQLNARDGERHGHGGFLSPLPPRPHAPLPSSQTSSPPYSSAAERQLQEDVLRNLKEQEQVMAIMQAQADARLMYAGRAPSRSANGLLETYF